MGSDAESLLSTQRPLGEPQLRELLASVGEVANHHLLTGGTFSAVQGVTLTDGRRVVVKTAVPVGALPDGRTPLLSYERDMLRSERDMLAVLGDDPTIPSPGLLADDIGTHRFGVDAIAMERLDGTPWDTVHDQMSEAANSAAHERVGEILAALHHRVGDRFGYPAGDFALSGASMPEFFGALIEATLGDADEWGVDVEPDRTLAAVEAGRDALAEVTRPHLIHNDLWLGNVLLDPATGEVHGVVDFERALYADPLWDFVGGESMSTGSPTPARLSGYARWGAASRARLDAWGRADTSSGLGEAADTRMRLYRLWSMAVQAIEIVPRGFHGDWVTVHRAKIERNRAALLAQAGV